MTLVAILLKGEGSQINDFSFHLKKLEKEGQHKPKVCRKNEIIRLKTEINKIEKRKAILNLMLCLHSHSINERRHH